MLTLNHVADPVKAGLDRDDVITIRAEGAHEIAERDVLLARAMAPDWRTKASEKLRRGRLPAANMALERFTLSLNREGFPSVHFCDSRCWLERRPASDDSTSFQ